MTEQAALASYRLKLPCADEREFREKFLQKYVSRGVFVPSERPKPVGTRLRLKLEIRGGTVLVSGDGMVTSVTQPGGTTKPGMTVRLTALHHDSIQFPLSPTAPATPHPPAPKAQAPSHAPPTPALGSAKPPPKLDLPPPPVPHAAPATTPAPAAPQDTNRELFELGDEDFEPAAPDEGVMAVTDPAIPVPPELAAAVASQRAVNLAEPEPSPEPAPLPPPAAAPGAAPRASKRSLRLLLIAGLVVAIAAAAAGIAASRSSRATRQASARVEEQLRLADLRLLEGRLAGGDGDSALDHLRQAKEAAPGDARVASRLALLADKFEQLGDRALARKNLREASVHYEASLAADPQRASVRAKLDDIASRTERAAPTP